MSMTTRQMPDAVRERAILIEKLREVEALEDSNMKRHAYAVRTFAKEAADYLAALDSRAGDAGEGVREGQRVRLESGETGVVNRIDYVVQLDEADGTQGAMGGSVGIITVQADELSHTPAVPAGEVERLARIRTSMALLQQNSEGCALNHYGDDANIHGMPGWLIDTKADLDAFIEILAQREADRD